MITKTDTAEVTAGQPFAGAAEISPLDRLAWPAEAVVAPTYTKPKFGARALAEVIDLCVCGIPLFAAVLLSSIWVFLGLLAVPVVLWAVYYWFTKDGRNGGRSIGKDLLDLMVVNVTTNRPCTEAESMRRQLDLCLLQMIPVVGWLVEPVFMIASKDGRRLGDRAAGTRVIVASEYRPAVHSTSGIEPRA